MEQLPELPFQPFHGRFGGVQTIYPAGMDLVPEAFDRMQHQRPADRRSLRDKQAEPRELRFQCGMFPVPRRLMQERPRIIPFCLPLHGIPRQMRAAHIDAQKRLPVCNVLVIPERHLPARRAEQLRKLFRLPKLPRSRLQLLDGPRRKIERRQIVDPRLVQVFIAPHQRAGRDGLRAQTVLMQKMSRRL